MEENNSEKVQSPYMDFNVTVSCGILSGMMFESINEASSSVNKNAEHAFEAALNKIRSSPDKPRQCWLMRDVIMKRAAHGPIAGGVCYGVFAATFVGINNWLVKNRGVDHTFNTGVAGTVACATFCLMSLKGLQRHQRVMVGAVGGAGVSFPVGLATQKLADRDKERNALRLKLNEQGDIKHVAGAITKD